MNFFKFLPPLFFLERKAKALVESASHGIGSGKLPRLAGIMLTADRILSSLDLSYYSSEKSLAPHITKHLYLAICQKKKASNVAEVRKFFSQMIMALLLTWGVLTKKFFEEEMYKAVDFFEDGPALARPHGLKTRLARIFKSRDSMYDAIVKISFAFDNLSKQNKLDQVLSLCVEVDEALHDWNRQLDEDQSTYPIFMDSTKLEVWSKTSQRQSIMQPIKIGGKKDTTRDRDRNKNRGGYDRDRDSGAKGEKGKDGDRRRRGRNGRRGGDRDSDRGDRDRDGGQRDSDPKRESSSALGLSQKQYQSLLKSLLKAQKDTKNPPPKRTGSGAPRS